MAHLPPLALTLTLWSLAICLGCRSNHDSETPDPERPASVRLNEHNGSAILGEWAIESVDGAGLFEPATPYLAFEPDGTIHGDASVNTVSGSWSWMEDFLELSPLATTLVAGPPMLMTQERTLLSAIERVNAARIAADGRLELFELGGDTLIRAQRPEGVLPGKLQGTVYYRERIALRPGHRVRVVLVDISRADAEGTVLGVFEGAVEGQVPIPFELSYDTTRVHPGRRYGLRATLQDANGQLAWTTTEVHPFDPNSSETGSIELLVERVP